MLLFCKLSVTHKLSQEKKQALAANIQYRNEAVINDTFDKTVTASASSCGITVQLKSNSFKTSEFYANLNENEFKKVYNGTSCKYFKLTSSTLTDDDYQRCIEMLATAPKRKLETYGW